MIVTVEPQRRRFRSESLSIAYLRDGVTAVREEEKLPVPMDGREREVLTLHLQLGAVRTILARKGAMSEAELSATLAQLETISTTDEVLGNDSVEETFDRLLRRVEAD